MTNISTFNPYEANATSIDAWGRPKSYIDKSLFHGMWTFDIPASDWRVYESGAYLLSPKTSSNVNSINGRMEIVSGTNTNEITMLKSKRSPRYQPNKGHLFSTALGLPSPTALGQRDFGLFTVDNGVFFRLKSDGKLYACVMSGSILVKEEEITMPFSIDLSRGNVFDIQFQWRGVGDYFFFVVNPSNGHLVKVHTISFINTLDSKLSIENPALPVCYRCKNKGDNVKIWAGCVDVSSEGGTSENLSYDSVTTGQVTLPTNAEYSVLAVKISETFNGKINTRDTILDAITTSCNNESYVSIYFTNDPSAFTGTTWTDHKDGDHLQYSIDGDLTVDLSNVNLDRKRFTRVEQDFTNVLLNNSKNGVQYLTAGDFVVVTIDAANGNTAAVSVEFTEEV